MAFTYPPAPRSDVVDDYHGTPVADPYRWLEDSDSDETLAFVSAQNALTLPYLASLPERNALRERMEELWDVPRTGAPAARAGTVVWSHNDGLSEQPTIYVRTPGSDEPEVLLDPSELSDDGTVAVVTSSLSPDGRHWAYSVADAGSDWQVIRVRSTQTGDDLSDELRHVKFTTIAWHGDGFFYARFPEHEPGSTAPSRNQSVWFHRIGTSQAADERHFANPDQPDLGYVPQVTHDGRYLILVEWEGTSNEHGLLYRRLGDGDGWTRLVERGVARHDVLTHHDGSFLVVTDRDAPNGKLVAIPLDRPDDATTLVAEEPDVLEAAIAAAGRLILVRLRDASHRLMLHALDGTRQGEMDLPGPCTVTAIGGRLGEPDVYIGYQSFAHPPSVLRVMNDVVEPFAGAEPPVDPSRIVVERKSATSTDGAEVGMFVVRLAGTDLPAPTELYGYGGFDIAETPKFDPARLAFLAAGGVSVVANLRGGSEHGEGWHRAGMLGAKQQVFEDFVACASALSAAGIAAPGGLGIRGRSNGGLLTAAVMLQRPDLFGAVVSTVPVTDMLRYQHFTAGRYWTVEYGDAADPDAFRWLIAYSPYHRVTEGADYPPVLITTAESDDRVVPMHALKFAAALQHAAGGSSTSPRLVRIDTRAGHGLGKPTSKLIDESADVYGFLLHHLTSAGPGQVS